MRNNAKIANIWTPRIKSSVIEFIHWNRKNEPEPSEIFPKTGSGLARRIGKEYKVLLIKQTFQEPLYGGLQKCCGGLLDQNIFLKNLKIPFMYNSIFAKIYYAVGNPKHQTVNWQRRRTE